MLTKKWMALYAVILISVGLLFSYFGKQGYSDEEKISTAEVFFDIASKEDRIIEMEADIKYHRYDALRYFVLSSDEAGDRAFGTALIAYRTAASKIPFSELITEDGKKLLQKKAWEEIEFFNDSSHEPVRITGVNIKNMTPDPEAESAGRPTMLFLNEESGDTKAGI